MNTKKSIKLFDKEASVQSSPIMIAYQILRCSNDFPKNPRLIQEDRKISIFKLLKEVKKTNPQCHPKQFFFALLFMYSVGIIEFSKPYIIIKRRYV